ncbi:MAG: DNA topoisomerase, partial [Lachnospiraceae bacterium]|nr:DNA topoisomerase [Lachnospiraceae bacterium]
FGSIEGDGAAAMRYTEARLQKITEEAFLSDLDKNVVDFMPNFDETEKEPVVLPVRVPNILINGAEGIAVGMATSIPTHNLGEVIDGVIAYMKNPDINTEQMMEYIPGPDFPTGGIVTNKDELHAIYSTGVGKIKLRGKVEIEKLKGGHTAVVITEIPYTMIGANIGKFLNDIFALAENKLTTDIVDISNQSSKEGIRIVIELKKGADLEYFLNLLYKKTRLEDTFGVNMLSVCDGKPETLGLVPMIRHHVNFQYELATRKYTTLLAKEREKKEVQEGLIKACDVIDLIIEILRGSKNINDARECLINGVTDPIRFKSEQSKKDAALLRFTERQAKAILDMRLYRLIGLEIEALRKQYEETMQNISDYTEILEKKSAMAKVIIKDLKNYKKNYAVERKTAIDNIAEAVVEEKPIEEIDVAVLLDRFAYARVVDMPTYERNKDAAEAECKKIIFCKNTDRLFAFTAHGQQFMIKVLDLPFGKFRDKGLPVDNVSKFDASLDHILFVEAMANMMGRKLVFGTKSGMIKTVAGEEFDVTRRQSQATKLNDGDEVLCCGMIEPEDTLVMQSKDHYFLRILADTIPEKKKPAVGVRGMRLSPKDEMKAIYLLHAGDNTEAEVRGKKIALKNLHIGNRDTKGVKR